MLRGLIKLDLYSYYDPRSHEDPHGGFVVPGEWMHYLHSLQTLVLGQRFSPIDSYIYHLWKSPTMFLCG